MFTGIVKEVGRVASIKPGNLTINAKDVLKDLKLGDSIAVNGVCLTVTTFDGNSFSVDVMQETLKRSNLGNLSTGDRINLELPLTLGSFVGGHLVQGHVDDIGKLISVKQDGAATLLKFETSPDIMRYIVEKGFIAIDGISLTVINRTSNSFEVSIVTHTYKNTNLDDRKVGDRINLEIDIIAKYVEQLTNTQGTGVTADFLREHGFSVS
ncbi:riboflavin synthase [Chloroflexota bacterium]